jgi:replication factor C small subunit
MESYTSTCRFILSCNYSSKIIEPIQSRCAVFRFTRLPKEDVKKYLEGILKKEGVKYEVGGLDAILYVSEGDMRRAVNILQSAAAIGKVDEDNVYSITTRARPEDIKSLLELALAGKFIDARNLLDKLMLTVGLSGEDILLQMNREAMNLDKTDDKLKVRIIDLVGEANFTLVEGANERIQLEALLARLALLK